MNLEEKISSNDAAVELSCILMNWQIQASAKFEYLIKESKSYISHAVNVSELRLTKLNRPEKLRPERLSTITIAPV